MPQIQFFSEDTSFTPDHKDSISLWVQQSVINERFQLVSLNFIFCSDEYLLSINQEYLKHDYYTDIITFDNSVAPKDIEGDIFISADRVKENANRNSVVFSEELKRILIHGVLHLCDYNDKTADQKALMTEKENAYLSLAIF
jgi:rRNA maturation RNase YbeY